MLTSARPRTLVLWLSDVTIDVAMLGPRGQQLGERYTVPLTTETATLWRVIDELGEFDRITLIGSDPNELAARIARESQRPLRAMSEGVLRWNHVLTGRGTELALSLAPRFKAHLYLNGAELPGTDFGAQLVRKDKRLREYLAPRVLAKRGEEKWLRRVSRALDELIAVWNPTTLYIATPPELPMPAELDARVVVVPAHDPLVDALSVWNEQRESVAAHAH